MGHIDDRSTVLVFVVTWCRNVTIRPSADLFDGCDESIPAPRESFDESGRLGGVAQGVTEPSDRGVQALLEIDERVACPEARAQFLTSDQHPRPFEQGLENLQRLVLKGHPDARPSELRGKHVQLEDAEPDQATLLSGRRFHGNLGVG